MAKGLEFRRVLCRSGPSDLRRPALVDVILRGGEAYDGRLGSADGNGYACGDRLATLASGGQVIRGGRGRRHRRGACRIETRADARDGDRSGVGYVPG